MRSAIVSLASLVASSALLACTSTTAPPVADVTGAPPAPAVVALTPTVVASAPAPAAAPPCGPTAYRHASPAFCIDLPAGGLSAPAQAHASGVVSGVLLTTAEGMVSVQWVRRDAMARLGRDWRVLAPSPDEAGTYDVRARTAYPGGFFAVVHDATQSRTKDIWKVPSLDGIRVIERGDDILRCRAVVSLEHDEDPRDFLARRRAFLDLCRSLHTL